MIAYKFLSSGAVGPFTGFRWPAPAGGGAGAWVDAPDARPDHGVHACRVADLAFWLNVELWRAELSDPVLEGKRHVVGARGRLLERLSAWDEARARGFAEACVWRARDRSVAALRREAFDGEAELLARCGDLAALRSASSDRSWRPGLPAALARYLSEAVESIADGDWAVSTYITARAAVAASGGNEGEFGAERERQACLMAEQLGL